MRPVSRDDNPTDGEFCDHNNARPYLFERIGPYCSYCERQLSHHAHVEHLKHKDEYEDLYGVWDNYLLSCSNCNSTKGTKDPCLDEYVLPDRDNTTRAFEYTADGKVEAAPSLSNQQQQMAEETISLVGLNANPERRTGRVQQRKNVRLKARRQLQIFDRNSSARIKSLIIDTATETGFFSIWMDVFENHPDMRQRFIEAFPGTANECFDRNTQPVSPRPTNEIDHLAHAGKV